MSPPKDEKKKPSLDRVKSSVFSRGFSIAKMTFRTGASLAGQGIATAMASQLEKEEGWKTFLKKNASFLTKELGELKGSLMKAGQMLSMYGEHFLPTEATEVLKALQSQSPPLKWEAIEKVLTTYLTPEQLDQLEIDHNPLASASMGQVHRARIKATQESICLKIQYPNVDRAIDSDLRALKSLLGLMKMLPKNFNLDPVFTEIRDMLVQETRYDLEAEITQKFYALLKDDRRYVVPKVFPEFSNRKVLATSFEYGLRVDDESIQAISQERRNQLALNFLNLYYKELFEWRLMQTDPHSGNYLIRIHPDREDQLVLLDFGATRSFSEQFLSTYHRMIKAAFYNDTEKLTQAAGELNLVHTDDAPEVQKIFAEFCFETMEPFRDQDNVENTYDWKNTDLPQRLSKKIFRVLREHPWRTPPSEFIFLDRKTGGVFIFLSVLRAKINARELLLKYLEKIP